MKLRRLLGILLVTAGVLALIYGGFSYQKKRGDVDIGPIEFQLTKKEKVQVPTWAGAAALVAGLVLVAWPDRR